MTRRTDRHVELLTLLLARMTHERIAELVRRGQHVVKGSRDGDRVGGGKGGHGDPTPAIALEGWREHPRFDGDTNPPATYHLPSDPVGDAIRECLADLAELGAIAAIATSNRAEPDADRSLLATSRRALERVDALLDVVGAVRPADLAQCAGLAVAILRRLDFITHQEARERGRQHTGGDCGACGRYCSNAPDDRIRSGYCAACYHAWRRTDEGSGRMDRLAFERSRRDLIEEAPRAC